MVNFREADKPQEDPMEQILAAMPEEQRKQYDQLQVLGRQLRDDLAAVLEDHAESLEEVMGYDILSTSVREEIAGSVLLHVCAAAMEAALDQFGDSE